MAKVILNSEGEFVVRESKLFNFILAGAFLAIAISSIVLASATGTFLYFISIVTLLIAIGYYRRGLLKSNIIKVNRIGFFHYGRLITNWDNFLSTEISQKHIVLNRTRSRYQDNFVLVLIYRKDYRMGTFRSIIPLTNTQNKAEEEVVAAIKFFYKITHGTKEEELPIPEIEN